MVLFTRDSLSLRLEDMTEYYSNDGVFTKEEAAEWCQNRLEKAGEIQ